MARRRSHRGTDPEVAAEAAAIVDESLVEQDPDLLDEESEGSGDDAGEASSLALAVGAEHAGLRLDQALAALTGESRARVQALIRTGQAAIGGRTIGEPSRRVNEGETLTLVIPALEPALPEPEDIPLDIVYEDDALIVIDKPAGLVVHPAPGHRSGTLVNALLHHCGERLSGINGVRRPGIVHRLDKDTSGLLVVAKSDRAHRKLALQFADHGRTGPLERIYTAIVWSGPKTPSGTVDAAIGRSPQNRLRQAVVRSGGREAVTHFRVVERYGPTGATVAAMIECSLETGRTHQIRVHMAHIGAPVIGDPEYAGGFRTKAAKLPEGVREAVAGFPRQALHAGVLAFAHPITGEELSFESPMPEDMVALAEALGSI